MSGRDIAYMELIPELVTGYIRRELKGLPTASFGRITSIDEATRRATVEVYPDGTTETGVPIAAPFAGDGAGDVAPLDPETVGHQPHGILLYPHHTIEEVMGGSDVPPERDHDDSLMLFIPAMVWRDDDSVPDHEPGERVFEHPAGGRLRMADDAVEVSDPRGAGVEVGGVPTPDEAEIPPEFPDAFKAEDRDAAAAADNTTFPVGNPGESYAQLGAGGPTVVVNVDTVAITGDGQLSAGAPTDGARRVLDGKYQHAQLVAHDDGTYDLVGQPLTFRAFVARLTDETQFGELNNQDADWVQDAKVYAEAYLDWLEAELGRSVDPTDPADWPDPEPMPSAGQKDAFDPNT